MSISDGEKVNAAASNAAWMSRKVDTDTLGVVGLQNVINPDSGSTITNAQRAINKSFDTSGITGEADATAKTYSSTNYITNGDDRKVAIGKLDAQAGTEAGNLSTHIADTTTHGTAGAIVGVSDTQTLTNKTIDADNNSISNLEHGAEVDNPSSGVHGVVGSVIGTTDTQTLTNKTFDDEITVQEIATPSTPASGYQAIYPKADGSWYTIDDTGSETELGAGGGGLAGINYVENYDFEVDNTKWTSTDQTNFNMTRTTTTPLRGVGSMLIQKAASDESTEYVYSDTFTIDTIDTASMMTLEFESDCTHASYVDGDIEARIWSVDDSSYLDGSYEVLNKYGKQTVDFQTLDSTNTQYQVRFYCASTNASTYFVKFDNILFGPQKSKVYGTPSTDWENFAPSLKGSITDPTPFSNTPSSTYLHQGRSRRVGDSMEIEISYYQESAATGTSTGSGTYYWEIPNGHVVDTAKLAPGSTSDESISSNFGVADLYYGGRFFGYCRYYNGGIGLGIVDPAGLTNTVVPISSTIAPLLDATTIAYSFRAIVPIQGWSSSVVMSETTLNREVSVIAISNSNETIAGSTAIPFSTITRDTTSSFSGTVFTAPEDGTYEVDVIMHITAKSDYWGLWVNGSSDGWVGKTSNEDIINGTKTLYLNKGDTLSVRFNASTALVTGANHRLMITKLNNGSQTIAQSEVVKFEYTGNGGTTIVASTTNIDFDTLVYDSHGAFSGTTFTAPKDMDLLVTGVVYFSTGGARSLSAYKNGSLAYEIGSSPDSTKVTCGFSNIIPLDKGDTFTVRSFQAGTLFDSATSHYIIGRSL